MENKYEMFRELIELSLNEKRGLIFFIGGQTIAGAVERVVGTAAVEIRSQMHSRAVVALDAVDAVAVV